MDRKTFAILRNIRDNRCRPSSYVPYLKDLGLPPETADLYRLKLIDVADDPVTGCPVYILLSAGRAALEVEEARIMDNRPCRRFVRWAIGIAKLTAGDIWRAIIAAVVSALVSFFVSRYCATKFTNDILDDLHGQKAGERAEAGN